MHTWRTFVLFTTGLGNIVEITHRLIRGFKCWCCAHFERMGITAPRRQSMAKLSDVIWASFLATPPSHSLSRSFLNCRDFFAWTSDAKVLVDVIMFAFKRRHLHFWLCVVLLSTELNNFRCVCARSICIFLPGRGQSAQQDAHGNLQVGSYCPGIWKVRHQVWQTGRFRWFFIDQWHSHTSPRSPHLDPIVAAFGRWKCANFRRSRATLKLRRRHRKRARRSRWRKLSAARAAPGVSPVRRSSHFSGGAGLWSVQVHEKTISFGFSLER